MAAPDRRVDLRDELGKKAGEIPRPFFFANSLTNSRVHDKLLLVGAREKDKFGGVV